MTTRLVGPLVTVTVRVTGLLVTPPLDAVMLAVPTDDSGRDPISHGGDAAVRRGPGEAESRSSGGAVLVPAVGR